MNDWVFGVERVLIWLLWVGIALASAMSLIVMVVRVAMTAFKARLRRLERRYRSVINRALRGDGEAIRLLVRSPARDQLHLARLIINPLIEDRDPERIAATREIAQAMSLVPLGDQYMGSRWWWRRAVALRGLGLIQFKERSSQIVAALDDESEEVRNAALDALADIRDPETLPAIVVRFHDASLHRGRRAAALAAFGSEGEGFLLNLAAVHKEHRLNYARALAICGTARSRPMLCEWTADDRVEVRASAFEALAHVGLDEQAASLAINALDSPDVSVREKAAAALHGWTGPGGASALARHLDDAWPVAIRAARSLKSMDEVGRIQLESRSSDSDIGGELARQMLWEMETHP
jgi:HEAT repeat protein